MTNKDINEYIASQLGLNQYTMVDDFQLNKISNSFMGKALYGKSVIPSKSICIK